MGLDQYLFRTTKKRKDAIVKFRELCTQYRAKVAEFDKTDRAQNLMNALAGKRKDEAVKVLAEQKDEIEFVKGEYRRIAEEVGIRIDEGFLPEFNPSEYGLTEKDNNRELAYWRKELPLHNFIIHHFGNPKDDNLVEVWLDKEAMEKIIEAGYFQEEFRDAMTMLDEEHVVYYWPWY